MQGAYKKEGGCALWFSHSVLSFEAWKFKKR